MDIDDSKLPYDELAEQAVLGTLLLGESADSVLTKCTGDDFHKKPHQVIFRTISEMMERGGEVDIITVADELTVSGHLEKVGGVTYLNALCESVPSNQNAGSYADIVRDHAAKRQVIKKCVQLIERATSSAPERAKPLLEDMELGLNELFHKYEKGGDRTIVSLREAVTAAVQRMDEVFHSDGDYPGLPTGITEVDNLTGGFRPADLIIIAGRPSMGKTTYAMNIAENAVKFLNAPTGVFSLEMPHEQLATRMISSWGRINADKLRTVKTMDDSDWTQVTATVGSMVDAQLFIDDEGGISLTDLRSRARKLKREHDIKLLIIDYLQLIKLARRAESRQQEISEISRSLKALAKELQIPIVALSQLSRDLEKRNDKRPIMSDLRESGQIEQDADIIQFIYRDEIYNPDTTEKGVAEIITAKQRNGGLGTARTAFRGEFTRFEDLISNWD